MNKAIKIISLVGKFAGIIAGLNTIPGVSPQTGLYIFAAASILKDVANRVNEILEQGPQSQAPKVS
jgi:hypothetical protein